MTIVRGPQLDLLPYARHAIPRGRRPGRPRHSRDLSGKAVRHVTYAEAVRGSRIIGAEIRAVRESLRVSASELAAAIGVHDSMIHRWERSRSFPPTPRLYQIAAALGVSPASLFPED